jgi:thiamine-phosphate pyrophosphorylase
MRTVSRPAKAGRIPLLCYVTDRRSFAAAEPAEAYRALLERIADTAASGIDWIQIREKDLSGRESSALAQEALQRAANPAGAESAGAVARILVNDRLDVALAVQAGGVHLGEKSVPPQEARRLANTLGRKDFLVGVSCHSLEAAKAAERNGADYLFFGPVFATPSKAGYGAPQGLERLAEVCRAVSAPVLAIGGVKQDNCAACLTAGASGIAAIRLFQDAADLPSLVQTLRRAAA